MIKMRFSSLVNPYIKKGEKPKKAHISRGAGMFPNKKIYLI